MIGGIAQVKIVLISRGKFPDSSGWKPVSFLKSNGREARANIESDVFVFSRTLSAVAPVRRARRLSCTAL